MTKTMKFGVMSDLHIPKFSNWTFERQPDVFYLCAGDISEHSFFREDWIESREDHLFAIRGNHDYYYDTFDYAHRHTQLREVNGIKIAGATLWTRLNPLEWIDYTRELVDYRLTPDMTYERYCEVHETHKRFLFESEADVIVTHHCPTHLSIHDKYAGDPVNCCFANDLYNDIMDMKKQPKLWVHGHTHERLDYMIGETRVVCNPRGYTNEMPWYKDYEPQIVEVEFD